MIIMKQNTNSITNKNILSKRLQLKISNIIPIVSLIFMLVLYTSCKKVLNQKPKDYVDESVAITDTKTAQTAVAGLYNQLQDQNYYGRNFLIMSDVSSDEAQSIGTWDFYREMDTYQISTGNTENGYFYSRAYQTIYVANYILQTVPGISGIPDATRNAINGAAYFVRGLVEFDLLRVYAGEPTVTGVNSSTAMGIAITTKTETASAISYPARATMKASYDQVESDLLQALNLLPESADKSQASKGAVRALLSRLYLYEGRYDDVITYSNQVISDSKYVLNPSFTNIFSSKLTSEAIFELSFNETDQSYERYWYYPTSQGGRGEIVAHPSFRIKAMADASDIRGTMFTLDASSSTYYPTKYNKTSGLDNIHVLRVAEMYLNRAEAKAQRAQVADLADAIADVNIIRKRSGAAPIAVPATKQATLQAVWNEQILEFAYEGHSFFDYCRTNQALTQLVNMPRKNSPTSVSIPSVSRELFPIPLFEINANKSMVQNEAYR
jgi:hypothetical protein